MYKNKKIVAIIPARSGSKGLPNKNIKDLAGKPLIAHTIEAAIQCDFFDDVIVSTDSEKYAEISKKYGASVPFLRSKENSSDDADSWSVVKEVLNKLEKTFDIVVLLQPTSPFRTAENIKKALELFIDKSADTVASVSKSPHPIQWCNTLPENKSLYNFISKEYLNKRRQDLPQGYTLNGAIYIVKSDLIQSDINLFGENSYAYIMDEKSSIDIDNELNFSFAQFMIGENNARKN